MGIPLYFKTISEKYPDIIIDLEKVKTVNGLFLDLNCAIHPCCRTACEGYKASKKNQFEKRMINEVLNYIDKLVVLIGPQMVYLAIDGVAPAAKMQQQRLRRYKSILERAETNKIKDRFKQEYNHEFWDTNAISPGTEFMDKLSNAIEYHIKVNDIYKSLDVIFSNQNVPGEGEHKIFNFIKQADQNDLTNVVYGLDADLIMLSMASKRNNIYLLREAIEFGNKVNMDRFLYLDIDELKENLSNELLEKFVALNHITLDDPSKIENFSYDYVFMCYLLGNDFLPHLASVNLKNDGLDQILDVYMQTYYHLNENFIDSDKCKVNSLFLKHFITKLSQFEYDNLKLQFYQRGKFSLKYKKYETEFLKHMDLLNNYPMFNREKELEMYIEKKGWDKRYYQVCFGVSEPEEIDEICHNYFEGLKWTLEYYFNQCASWQWKYNYRHGPLLKDLSNYLNKIKNINTIKISKSQPNTPLVQLLTILPQESNHLLPNTTHQLMDNIDSEIIDIYPIEYKLDTVFKRYYWQCVPILPSINYKKVKDAITNVKLTKDEKNRFKKEIPICKKAKNGVVII